MAQMKAGLDEVSLRNLAAAAEGVAERSGARLADVDYLCRIHMKPSMHRALVAALGIERAAYLTTPGSRRLPCKAGYVARSTACSGW